MMDTPLIIINFKVYDKSIGKNAYNLAKIIEDIAIERNVNIAIAPNFLELIHIKESVNIPVLAQHSDAVTLGSYTGHVPLELLKEYDIDGVLINHSEKSLALKDIEYLVTKANSMKLSTVLCTNNLNSSIAGAALAPEFLAIEPPELIGGNVSVAIANPKIVSDTVKYVKNINNRIKVLCGAGIKNKEDSKTALKLGADGILVASGIVKAKDPYTALNSLIDGLLEAEHGQR